MELEASYHAAPAGTENPYQYNGQELHEDFGLGWYAYGARWYDPAIARFTGVGPIADEFAWVSPYNYAENTPTNAIDLHGLQAFYVHGTNQNNVAVTDELRQTLNYLVENVATLDHKIKKVNTGFDWSAQAHLTNDSQDRATAAQNLADYVVANHVKGEPITLIGYSHGGNVSAQAASLISEALGDIEVNMITMATPASNQISGPLSRDGIPQGTSRFSENPDNPGIQRAVLDWYHFYAPNDPVAGGASMIYESSDLNYRSERVKNIRVSPANVPRGMGNAHSFPYYPKSISSAWTRFPVKERQRSPLTTKR